VLLVVPAAGWGGEVGGQGGIDEMVRLTGFVAEQHRRTPRQIQTKQKTEHKTNKRPFLFSAMAKWIKAKISAPSLEVPKERRFPCFPLGTL